MDVAIQDATPKEAWDDNFSKIKDVLDIYLST